ncbi:MAG TPA: LacI family DNA-binding transcriptional regulator, partial [Ktedonobacteraceae bacterium]
ALNYTPNSLARSLRVQRSNLLAVLVGDNTDPYFAEIARGVEEVANEHGYLTIICNAGRDPRKELYYLRSLQDYRIDGVIFAGSGLNIPEHIEQLQQIAQQMQKRGAKIITLSQHTLPVPSIQADNFDGARQMATRLIDLGHRRIAFVSGPSDLLVANARLQGYMAALVEAGYTIDPMLILPGNFTHQSGELAAYQAIHMAPEQRPTAIFAANDETALGVLQGIARQGLHVPVDFSVCGFGDLPLAQLMVPSLTSVHVPMRELGQMGARRLLKLLNDESVPSLDVLPTTIIERASTASLH